MPIASLEFDLPEEEAEFRAATQGSRARGILWDIDQRCRSLIKYNDAASDDARRLAEEIRMMIPAELLDD